MSPPERDFVILNVVKDLGVDKYARFAY